MREASQDDEPKTTFEVDLDDQTVARLLEIAEDSKTCPTLLIASIVSKVLEDDELAHADGDPEVGVVRSNSNRDLH